MFTTSTLGRRLALGGAALAGALLLAGTAAAQGRAADARWQPWLGCWSPMGAAALPGEPGPGGVVCVVPATGTSAVDLVTVDSGHITSRDHIDANGARRTITEDGCTGWQSAAWAPGGTRVYLRSSMSCTGGVHRTANGLLAMTPGGDWLEVREVAAGRANGVRVTRYRSTAVPDELRAELAGAFAQREAIRAARVAAGAPLTTADVIEASRALDGPTVAAWLVALRQDFRIDAKQLTQLADAHVPDAVVDAMVALSYPRKFAIASGTGVQLRAVDSAAVAAGAYPVTGPSIVMDPYGGYYGPYGYGYDPFFYGYGYSPFGFGWSPYGYGWYPAGGPIVIVKPSGPPAPHGKVVNGRGYQRGDQPAGSEREPNAGARAGGSSGAARGSSGAASPARTAKPRP